MKVFTEIEKEPKFYQCNLCEAGFEKRREYKEHAIKVHKKKRFKCKLCNDLFVSMAGVRSHVSTVHEGNRPFQCDVCEQRFTDKHTMKNHKTHVHEGVKRPKKYPERKQFDCHHCDLVFNKDGEIF